MQRSSVILVVLAVAVLASVFTYSVVSDDGEQAAQIEIKEVPEPGDFVQVKKTVDGRNSYHVLSVLEVEGDTVHMILTDSFHDARLVDDTLEGYAEDLTIHSGMYTNLEETDRVYMETYMGQRECIVYSCESKNPSINKIWVDAENGLVYSAAGEKDNKDLRLTYMDTSLLSFMGPDDPFELTDEIKSVDDICVGDYYKVKAVVDGKVTMRTLVVAEVDKAAGTVLCARDVKDYYGVCKTYEMTFEELFNSMRFDAEAEGAEKGERTIIRTTYGFRDCTAYTVPNSIQTLYVGTDTGIIYRIDSPDGSNQVLWRTSLFKGTSLTSSPLQVDEPKDAEDLEVGDHYSFMIYRETDAGITEELMTNTIVYLDRSEGIFRSSDGEGVSDDISVEEFVESITYSPPEGSYDDVRVQLMDTCNGLRMCNVYYYDGEIVAATGCESGILYMFMAEDDQGQCLVAFTDTTLFREI